MRGPCTPYPARSGGGPLLCPSGVVVHDRGLHRVGKCPQSVFRLTDHLGVGCMRLDRNKEIHCGAINRVDCPLLAMVHKGCVWHCLWLSWVITPHASSALKPGRPYHMVILILNDRRDPHS